MDQAVTHISMVLPGDCTADCLCSEGQVTIDMPVCLWTYIETLLLWDMQHIRDTDRWEILLSMLQDNKSWDARIVASRP